MSRSFLALQMLIAALWASGLSASVDFNRDIRPILSNHCFACHGPDAHERKGTLPLDAFRRALQCFNVEVSPAEGRALFRKFGQDGQRRLPYQVFTRALFTSKSRLLAWTHVHHMDKRGIRGSGARAGPRTATLPPWCASWRSSTRSSGRRGSSAGS